MSRSESFSGELAARLSVGVAAGLATVCMAWHSNGSLAAITVFFTILGIRELNQMFQTGGHRFATTASYALALLFLASGYINSFITKDIASHNLVLTFFIVLFLIVSWTALRKGEMHTTAKYFLIPLFGAIYVGGSLSLLFPIHAIYLAHFATITPYDFLILLPLTAAWAPDTGAFITGKLLGHDKLAPKLSEKKSVEGLIGGLAAGLTTMLFFGKILSLATGLAIAVGILLPLAGTAGDLFESSIKRRFGVKDAGTFFKAHGGVLDRFDSLLFVLPVTYIILYFVYWPK